MVDFLNLFDPSLFQSIPRFATPILLAALGGLLCERAGVFNIMLEGLMLAGAFTGIVGAYFLGDTTIGVLASVLGGVLISLPFGLFAIKYKANMIVLGIATNLLVSGATIFLLRTIFNVTGAFRDPSIIEIKAIEIPILRDIPFIGGFLSGQSWLVYFSILLTIIINIYLFRNKFGLRLRGVGEHPEAASSLGISVNRIKFIAVILSGALCGLAGAQLSLSNVVMFVENMSAGRGWMAVVAIMLGQNNPLGVLGASFIFGFADSLGIRMQGIGLPSQFAEMLPYLFTLFVLVLVKARKTKTI